MTTVDTTTQQAAAQQAAAQQSAATATEDTSAEATTTISSDFETFLRMLTTQLENQDPLNPVEATDFAVQLATFSGVEQQVLTNDLLTSVSESLAAENFTGLTAYGDWIGKDALVAGPTYYDGSDPLTLDVALPAGTAAADLVGYDVDGNEVSRALVPPGAREMVWDGTSTAGTDLPAGLYRFEVEIFEGGEVASGYTVEVYNRIEEVQLIDNQVLVVMEGGALAYSDTVVGLRDPAAG